LKNFKILYLKQIRVTTDWSTTESLSEPFRLVHTWA